MIPTKQPAIGVLVAVATGLLLLVACDERLADAEDGGTDGPIVAGHCVEQPTSCDDLLTGDGELVVKCCFAEMRWWCQNGELFWAECSAGCTYDEVDDEVECAQLPSGGGGGGGDGPAGGYDEPPTDPGPGF